MTPKPLLPWLALLLLRLLLLLLPLQADPLHGGVTAVDSAPPLDQSADPERASMSLRLLDAFIRRPRQIRFKSSYLELPDVLRDLVGIKGLGHLSYFVQVDVPVTPPTSKALDRLPAGTKTYFPPYVSLLGTPAINQTTTEGPQHSSAASKTLAPSQAMDKQSGFGGLAVIPVKNISQVTDNKLDALLSTSTVSTSLGTDSGPFPTPSLAARLQNVSYSTSEISWHPQSFNFLHSSPLGVSSSPPHTIKVASSSQTITIPALTTTTTSITPAPQTAFVTTTPSTLSHLPLSPTPSFSSSSSFLSSYFFSIFSSTTPSPLTGNTSSSPPAVGSSRTVNLTPGNFSLRKTHTTTPRPHQAAPPPPLVSTTPTSTSLSSHLPAKYPPPVKSNSTASSFPLIKKHSSALKSFTLPSTSSPSSKSFAFPSPPSYSSLKSRAPTSKSSPPSVHSVTHSVTTVPSKHAVKYAKFTPTSSVVKSVKVLTSPSTSPAQSPPSQSPRTLRTTSRPRVIHSNQSSKTASGSDSGNHSPRRPSLRPPTHLASSASTTSSPLPPVRTPSPSALPTQPSKSSSRSSRLLNNFFSKSSHPSLPSSSSSHLLTQTRALPSLSSLPSLKHPTEPSAFSVPSSKLRPTPTETNPKTFSSTSTQVTQSPQGWKRGRVVEVGGNVKSKVGGAEGTGRKGGTGEGGKGGREGKRGGGTDGQGGKEGKAGKRTLGDIIRDRKSFLRRLKGGSKGVDNVDRVSRLEKLQIRNKSGKGNRTLDDRLGVALSALRTTPKPEDRTRPPDGDTDNDPVVPERGSADLQKLRSIPHTAFVCPDTSEAGYFADRETGCQVFHVCWQKRRATFLCPAGTLFNQRLQVCDWSYNVDCDVTLEVPWPVLV
ncbi:mucin-5AC-like [Portunus trituberculatus]|uniref:mucin-5AC-like n=1 Tax=Portunus trituberculatus TaxID=210409 RepID=UPI001E1CD960|nr:mucin-5AC-like [Portunus trituberculatus]